MKTIAQQLNVKEFPFIIKDSNGNEIYCEYSTGYWRKAEYDSKGNCIYFVNSKKEWFKREFDEQGSIIYYEDSGGYWVKREFDSNGNMIYYENSEGKIEDNRPIPEYTMQDLVDKIGRFKFKL